MAASEKRREWLLGKSAATGCWYGNAWNGCWGKRRESLLGRSAAHGCWCSSALKGCQVEAPRMFAGEKLKHHGVS